MDSCHSNEQQPGITLLPSEIHDERIVQPAVKGNIADVKKARLVSQCFRKAASAAVRTLISSPGCEVAAPAWKAFPCADGLRIHGWGARNIFDDIPQDRLRRIELGHKVEGLTQRLASTLCSAASARRLQQVILPPWLLPSQADALITSLPELEHLEATIDLKPGTQWSPAAGQQLRRLCISAAQQSQQAQQPLVDMKAVARSTGLQELHTSGIQPSNCEAVAGMAQLQDLSVRNANFWHGTLLQAASKLQQLHTLLLLCCYAQPEDWQPLLASMGRLSRLQLGQLELGTNRPEASKPSSSITWMSASISRTMAPWAAVDAASNGNLTSLLPALQELTLIHPQDACVPLGELLAGHQQLRSLCLRMQKSGTHTWPAGLLSSLPCLEELEVHEAIDLPVNSMLKDAAGCSRLRSILVQYPGVVNRWRYGEGSGSGLEALAAGACRGTLERVLLHIRDSNVPVARAVPLLQMPALKEAALTLGEEEWRAQRRGGMADAALPEPELLCSKLQQALRDAGLQVLLQAPAADCSEDMKDSAYVLGLGRCRYVQAELLVQGKVLRWLFVDKLDEQQEEEEVEEQQEYYGSP